MMMALVFLIPSITCQIPPTEFCPRFSNTDCGNCIASTQNLNYSCGYCADQKACIPGDNRGPFKGDCMSWHFTNDQFCKDDSSLAYSKTTRIIIGVIVAIISAFTLFFWIFLFPRIFKPDSLMDN